MLADGTNSCIRLRIRRKVDFPQPEGPMSAVTSPGGMISETRSRTLCDPNQADTERASMLDSCRASAVGTGAWRGTVSVTAEASSGSTSRRSGSRSGAELVINGSLSGAKSLGRGRLIAGSARCRRSRWW